MTQQRVSSHRSSQFSRAAGMRTPVRVPVAPVPPDTPGGPSSNLELGVSRTRNNTAVIRAVGEVDLTNASSLGAELRTVLNSEVDVVVVDLSSVEFLAISGLEVLAEAARDAADETATLRLVADWHPIIRAIQVGGLHEMVECYESVAEAVTPDSVRTA